ncbi:MAG: hypothetical protein GTO22_16285, partial [Gemmatimonadales bacterium]|nr:hypothetical protein [Gemmatimonadales bacterium]
VLIATSSPADEGTSDSAGVPPTVAGGGQLPADESPSSDKDTKCPGHGEAVESAGAPPTVAGGGQLPPDEVPGFVKDAGLELLPADETPRESAVEADAFVAVQIALS